MDIQRLQKLAGAVRTGGKGSVRRKKKAAHKTITNDDKRLQTTLKRLGVNLIPGIEEVNIFIEDTVVHFNSPKVQAALPANTYVVSGPSQTKSKILI
jgi:nascent polypeptide-associated complex subunit beta